MSETATLSSFTSPACGGGRRASSAFTRVFNALWRVGRGFIESVARALAPSPTLPRKRGREKRTRV
jgi:hypothetical protein